jgi:hypothetical protein
MCLDTRLTYNVYFSMLNASAKILFHEAFLMVGYYDNILLWFQTTVGISLFGTSPDRLCIPASLSSSTYQVFQVASASSNAYVKNAWNFTSVITARIHSLMLKNNCPQHS